MKIKDKLRAFGILVIRMFWPGKGRKSVQRLGILILGLGAMIGVSQAGPIQRLIMGSAESSAAVSNVAKTNVASLNEKEQAATVPSSNSSTTEEKFSGSTNIVDLIGESELIVRGMVKELTDGVEKGVPYTEVTIKVTEGLRGQFGEDYKFRQFGLLQPKKMGNGKVNLNVTPDGWAKFKQGEDVILFLYQQASMTGLRTTTGIGQGKLTVTGGNIETQFGNVGLFENVEADTKLLNDRDKRLLGTKKGPVNKESFLSFVRKAVKDKWIEGGKIRHAKK